MSFFGWFNPKNFMDTCEEWHAFVIGFGDGVAFTRTVTWEMAEIGGEPHYYKWGVAMGRFAIIGFVAAMLRMVL